MADGPTGFGGELRRQRIAAGVSLSQLARRTHYSKGYLSKIQNGHRTAGHDLAAQCDAALAAEGRLVSVLDAARLSAADATRDAVRSSAPDPALDAIPSSAPGSVGSRDGAWSAVTAAVAPSRALTAAGDEGAALSGFETMFASQRMLGLAVSPRLVRPLVETQTRLLLALAAAAHDAARTPLLLLAARHAEYAGWMAQEDGDEPAALSWTVHAARTAESQGDLELARYGLVRQAELSLYRGDFRTAVRLAVLAQEGGRGARVTGLAIQREAQAHALAGDPVRWRSAMERAAELLAAPDETGSALGPSSAPNLHALVTGWCLLDLGRPDEAADVLDREVPLIPESARRAAARFGVRRAMAHAAAGDSGQAATLVLELLPTATQVDSATVRSDLRRLSQVLARWGHRREVALARTELADALLPY
jgi:transcriptional regulator with XRE-family HTH domain